MSDPCGTRHARLVDRAFERGLSARQRRQLRAHLGSCTACREKWDRLAIIERQLGGPSLTAAMIDDIADAVIHPATRRSRRLACASVAGGLLATAAVLLVLNRPKPSEETLTPRGSPSLGRTPGVRMFCVAGDRDQVRDEVRMVSSGHVPTLRCMIDDDLQLAYSTPDREGLTMVAFATLDSSIIHYAPLSPGRDAIALRADRVDELVDWSNPLAVEHRPGTYEVIVRFFDGSAMPVSELRARLDVAPRGGLAHDR